MLNISIVTNNNNNNNNLNHLSPLGEVTTKDGIVIYNLEGKWDKGMDRVDPGL